MSGIGAITLIGIIAVVVLLFVFVRRHSADKLDQLMAKRKSSAKIVDTAKFVEGMEEIPVAISLTDKQLIYENPDLEAKLDLERIEEVEYTDELSTAHQMKDHGKVLRLRSHGHTFEFILNRDNAERWESLLPSHRMDEPANAV